MRYVTWILRRAEVTPGRESEESCLQLRSMLTRLPTASRPSAIFEIEISRRERQSQPASSPPPPTLLLSPPPSSPTLC
eukprot:2030093-Rhodomonas_salina.1